jgi:hypothetical protein
VVNFRRFNGTSDKITLSLGTAINTMTFGTIAVLCRRTDNINWNGPFATNSPGPFAEVYIDVAPSGALPLANALFVSYASSEASTIAMSSTEDWCWIAVSKATGNVAPRFHKQVKSTGTWTHAAGASMANGTSPSGGNLTIGAVATDWFKGDIAAVAVWTTALSDATLEGLGATWTAVLAASPQAAWLLNQASTATSLTDAVGTANQTAISGTTVQSGTITNWAESGTTPISGTDTSGSGAETATLVAVPAKGTETAAGAETASVVATVSSADTGAGGEGGAVALASVDPGAGAEAGSVVATLSGTDTAAGIETTALALAGADTHTSSEAGSVVATLAGGDTAAGTEAGSTPGGAVAKSDGDAAVGAETATVVATLAASDSSTSAEAISIALRDDDIGQSRNAADTASSVESAAVTGKTVATNESFATATETASVQVLGQTVAGVDTAAGQETGLVNVMVSASDAAASAESTGLRVIGHVHKPGSAQLISDGGVAQLAEGGKARLVLLGGRTEEA